MLLKPLALVALVPLASAFQEGTPARRIAVENGTGLEVVHVVPQTVTYRDRKALRLVEAPNTDGNAVAVINGVEFKDGTIDVDVAGLPGAGSNLGARGFVGLAFRSAPHAAAFECFYIRPSNGRADDQLRRNHATQYVSAPAYPWFRLRKENPGVYESYVDLESGTWTRLKIVATGTQARLYVNGAEQPALIVNDLKLGETQGRVALWADPTTDAYFSNLTIK